MRMQYNYDEKSIDFSLYFVYTIYLGGVNTFCPCKKIIIPDDREMKEEKR